MHNEEQSNDTPKVNPGERSQHGSPKNAWKPAEKVAVILSTIALVISSALGMIEYRRWVGEHKLVLISDVIDSTRSYSSQRRGAALFRPLSDNKYIQEICVITPDFGYDDDANVACGYGSNAEIFLEIQLARANHHVASRFPKSVELRATEFVFLKDSLPIVIESSYFAGGNLRKSRSLYAIHFTRAATSRINAHNSSLEMSAVVYVRDLERQERSQQVVERELAERSFDWYQY